MLREVGLHLAAFAPMRTKLICSGLGADGGRELEAVHLFSRVAARI